jgi:lipoprotein-releasing system permease protein
MNLSFFIAQRLRKSRGKSFTATVGKIGVASIAVGLAVMIVAFSIFFGFKTAVKDKIFSLSGQIQVKKTSRNQSVEELPLFHDTTFIKDVNSLSNIAHIQGVAHKTGILKTDSDLLGIVMKGVANDYDWHRFRSHLRAGNILTFSDTATSNQILISQQIANKLRLKVGSDIVIAFLQDPPRFRKLKVVGIYETGLEEIDSQLIIGDLKLIQKLNAWGKRTIGTYEIFVKDFDRINQATAQLSGLLKYDMAMETVVERFMAIFEWLSLLDRNVLVFLVLILAVACFNMISVLLVMMMERTSMIGLLKALGASHRQVRQIFVYQGIGIIVKGLLLGNLIGIAINWLQYTYHLVPLDPANYYMNYVPIEWHWEVIVLLNLLILILVSVVLLLPTRIVNQIQPIKAIQFSK